MSAKRFKQEPKKIFKTDAVHIHYKCHCPLNPELTFNDNNIEITVFNTCPTCGIGEAEEIIIGKMATEITRCQHPGCDCGNVFIQIPVHDFLRYLK